MAFIDKMEFNVPLNGVMSDDIARFFTAGVWLWVCACVGRYQYSRGRGCSTKQLSMRELPFYARGSPALRQQLGRFLSSSARIRLDVRRREGRALAVGQANPRRDHRGGGGHMGRRLCQNPKIRT